MSPLTTQLTEYYKDIQQRANLVDQRFDRSTKFTTIAFDTLQEGKLPADVTQELFDMNSEMQKGMKRKGGADKQKPIDVIISAVTLRNEGIATGLALIAAKLTAEGELQADLASTPPWIPSSRLKAPKVQDQEFMVGTLADFWRWTNNQGQEKISKAETWKDAVDYCVSMYDAVDEPEDREGLDPVWQVDREHAYITPGQIIKANGQILNLYNFLIRSGRKDEATALYSQLLSLTPRQQRFSDTIDDATNDLLVTASKAKGSMSDGFPLTASQRRAVHAFLTDSEGDITAVSGPPGTGKTTMLQSVVASLIVEHALEEKPAPLIVGMSTNNQAVTNIIDSFGSVTKDEPRVLEHRWLPVSEEGTASTTALSGLAVYCPSGAKVKEAKANGYLIENTGKSGVYSEYSTPEYLEAASARFLAKMNEFLTSYNDTPIKEIATAKKFLHSLLKKFDRDRRFILNERFDADQIVENQFPGGRRSFEDGKTELEAQYKALKDRYDTWNSAKNSPLGDDLQIETHYLDLEPAQKFATCAEFVDFYSDELDNVIARLGSNDLELSKVSAAESNATERFAQKAESLLGTAKATGLIPEAKLQAILTAPDLLALDQLLDTTFRYVEFWLAVHYYEATWLLSATSDELIDSNERWKNTTENMSLYWSQVTSLTPCFVMTAYQIPKYFNLYSPDRINHNFDVGRIDLLIVDEAGQVDTSVGAGAFALAKRALVVGDVKQLAPVWGVDPETDESIAQAHDLSDEWETMKEFGLTSSHSSSLMQAAACSSGWSYGKDRDPGLFLSEHFRCHSDIIEYCNDLLYKGQLVASRPLDNYALKDTVEKAFLFREVDNSTDRPNGSSRVNEFEANDIAEWIVGNFEYFREIYNPAGDEEKDSSLFGVVTPFAAQSRLIQRTLRAKNPSIARKVTVGTAHTLQGAERAVVLFSPVYGNNSGKASFIDNTLELMNVAVSRAKDLFIVFGGSGRWADSGPVFSLVRSTAVKGTHWFTHTPEESEDTTAESSASTEQPTSETKAEEATAPDASASQSDHTPQKADAQSNHIVFVEDGEDGFLVASQLLKLWRSNGTLPEDSKLSAAKFNQGMKEAGLIEKPDDCWMPTEQGSEIGIAMYERTTDKGTFKNVCYSPQSVEVLQEMVRTGTLML